MGNTNEYVLSFKKIKRTIKKLWMIIVCALVIGVVIVGLQIVKSKKATTKQVEAPSGNNTFEQITYVNVNWDESEFESPNDEIIERRMEIINSCKNLPLYDYVLEQINSQLEEKGFNKLSETDNISIVCSTSNIFGVFVFSQSGVDRVKNLSDIASNVIMHAGQKEYGLVDCDISNQSQIYLATKSGSNYVRTEQTAQDWLSKKNSLANNSFSIKSCIIIIGGCLVAALLILLYIASRDTTVTNQMEIANLYDIKYLGSVSSDKYITRMIAYLSGKINAQRVNLVNIDSDTNSDVDQVIEDLKTEIDTYRISVKNNNYDSLFNIKENECIVLVIKENVDRRDSVSAMIDFATKLNIPIVGYVWLK